VASAKTVVDEALKLPRGERADVVRDIIASLDGPADEGVEEAWIAEAERRQREAADDPNAFVDWETARAEISKRLRALRT
jgi:putative addiction module component (TIGR02574 family)